MVEPTNPAAPPPPEQQTAEQIANAATNPSAKDIKLQYVYELQTKAPEVYKSFLFWFANEIRTMVQRSSERLIQELKKQRRDSGSQY